MVQQELQTVSFQTLTSDLVFLVFRSEMSRQTATALPTGTSKCPPSQRVPTLSGTTASNSDLASLFECPVCFDYVLPPILQCQSGHLVRGKSRRLHLLDPQLLTLILSPGVLQLPAQAHLLPHLQGPAGLHQEPGYGEGGQLGAVPL